MAEELYRSKPGYVKAVIEVEIARDMRDKDEPSIAECRFAVLQLATTRRGGQSFKRYVVYDRLLNRIVDGVYVNGGYESALGVAAMYNEDHAHNDVRSPNNIALGLIYPNPEK